MSRSAGLEALYLGVGMIAALAKSHLSIAVAAPDAAKASPFDLLYRAHARHIAMLALHVLGRDVEVDDVVHDVFLKAMKHLGQLKDPKAARAWLSTITVRVARRKLRARRLLRFFGFDDEPGYEDAVAPGASPESRALLARVFAVLDTLPVSERLAWSLRYVEGEALDDVARLCGCSLATAKRRIAAAERALQEASDE